MQRNTISQGDVLEVLRRLPDESVQCCVTSPPYYGLRDYGLPPSIWGGDGSCPHTWQDDRYYTEQTAATASAEAFSAAGSANAERLRRGRWREDATCGRCGAWRGCLGLEPDPRLFVSHLVAVFHEVRRVLRPDGTLWLNLGDSYNNRARVRPSSHQPSLNGIVDRAWREDAAAAGVRMSLTEGGLKEKDLFGIPWEAALALRDDGWYLRSDIIWAKPNPMPESVRDRPTKSHEYVFLLTKSARYFYDDVAIREPSGPFKKSGPNALRGQVELRPRGNLQPLARQSYHPAGRNKRSVWTVATRPSKEAHFATYPPQLISPMILAGTSAAGCCAGCGAPRRRSTRVSYTNPGNRTTNGPRSLANRAITAGFAMRLEKQVATTGWHPTCGHMDAGSVPCVVLDPFCGSGTTLVVARDLGRDYIGIELSPEYIAIAQRRLAGKETSAAA